VRDCTTSGCHSWDDASLLPPDGNGRWHHNTDNSAAGNCNVCHNPSIVGAIQPGVSFDDDPPGDLNHIPRVYNCDNCHWEQAISNQNADPDNPGHPSTYDHFDPWGNLVGYYEYQRPVLSPFDAHHMGFRGNIVANPVAQCYFCHSLVGTDWSNASPPDYDSDNPELIRFCQRCHTKGQLHAIHASDFNSWEAVGFHVPDKPETDPDTYRLFSGDEVCLGCHGPYGPPPPNQPPVANAGTDQSVHPGNLVTLDGTASSDPDEDYPLTYAWQIISKPAGSTAALSNPDSVNPTFTVDLLGDYVVQLTVTDSLGLLSVPDEVLVSTYNTAPVADAGEDQAIIEIGSTVYLDGIQSWDDDGDTITYAWTITAKPAGSLAVLSDSTSPTPTFVADVQGDYFIELVVSDPWASSDPDTLVVSFDNVKPVADAGDNQSVVQGDTVYLDGSGSSDANLDPLTYSWSIVSKPTDSLAEIDDPTSEQTQLVTDTPGEYVVSLVVSDGFVASDPDNITIVALTYQDATTETLQDTTETINNTLDDSVFNNPNNKNALTNKINAALAQIDKGNYENALDKLQNDILGKTDGCAKTGAPEPNDWIEDCESQNEVYSLVMEAINLLQELI